MKTATTGSGDHRTVDKEGFDTRNDIFFAAVELTRMPMVVTDPRQDDNPIVFCNAAFADLTGYALGEIIGRNCRFLQGPDTDRRVVTQVRNSIALQTDTAVEMLNYRKDGSTFWNALFISPIFDGKDNTILYYFASQLDVSRRHDAEDALRQAQKMEAVGQLTGGIAHDFNNALQVIQGNIDMAERKLLDDPREAKIRLNRAREMTEKSQVLTAQMLAFARKQHLDGRPTNLNHLIRNLRALVGETLGPQVDIQTDLHDDLDTVNVDAVQTQTALVNVLVNARDAMQGEGSIIIRTANCRIDEATGDEEEIAVGDYVCLSLHDTGEGMGPEVLSRVLEPFFTTKPPGKGSGMGLSQVYGFMRQSRGHMRIKSELGKGTSVLLYFPSISSSAEIASTPSVSAQKKRETVLIVEDNEDVMELAQTYLREADYRILSATNAKIAQDILSREHVDILFTDIIMPGGMNGVTLANYVKETYSHINILLTTGWGDRAFEDETKRNGFPLLGKPYRQSDLLGRLKTLMSVHGE